MAREPQTPAAQTAPPTWTAPRDARPLDAGPTPEQQEQMRNPVQPSRAGGTVVVACKLPHGLRMHIHTPVENQLPVMGGGTRTEITYHRTGEGYVIKGFAHKQTEGPRAVIVDGSGFALTWGIPKDFWDEWERQNAQSDLVRKKLIYAHEDVSMVEGHAREYAKQESGLERIDPNKPARGITKSDAQRV